MSTPEGRVSSGGAHCCKGLEMGRDLLVQGIQGAIMGDTQSTTE